MSTSGYTGKGTVLSIGSALTTPTYTPVAQVKTYQFSGQTWKFEDVTNNDSTAAGPGVIEEFVPTVVSGGTMAISGVYAPDDIGRDALAAAFASGSLLPYKLQLPVGPTQTTAGNLFAFNAYVQEMPLPDVQFDKAMTFKCTLKIDSVITVTKGT